MSGVPKVPISSRVKPSTKVLIDKSKYTSGEMLDWAAQQFTDEKELVRIKIMDVEDRIQNKKIDLIADEMELENLQKMWVKLNPESEECKELLSDLVDVESKDYAEYLYNSQGERSYTMLLSNKTAKHSLMSVAKEKCLPKEDFLKSVIEHLKILCNTQV